MTSHPWTIAAALLAMLLSPGAWAHTAFDTSSPADGEVMKTAPAQFTLGFTEGIDLKRVRLTGADGTEWLTDWTKNDQRVFDAAFRSIRPLPPGRYLIDWAGVIQGHDDSGEIRFSIAP